MNPQEITRSEFLYLSRPAIALFYVLTFASIAGMLVPIVRRALFWHKGRDAEKWTVREALGNLLSYVLGQRKVRSSRRRSGAPMHLLLFYGFLTLFIGTTLLAINTYSPVKFHFGNYFLVYEEALDWMGLAFLVGVVWAFFRRLSADRTGPGIGALRNAEATEIARQSQENRRRPLSGGLNDYLTLGLLFVVGATGFLLEAARMRANPQPFDWSGPIGHALSRVLPAIDPGAYLAIWWFHMAWIWLFFLAIPHMRLRHIVMAIFSLSLRPKRAIGALRTIAMEEVEQTGKIGVQVATDYARRDLLSLDACMECGRCTEVCPAWSVGKVLNPKQVVQDVRGVYGSEKEVASAIGEEALWACTTCNACVEACPVEIRHVDLVVEARRHLVAEGRLAGSGAVMLRQVGSTGSAWAQPAANREDWMKGLDVPLCRDGAPFEYLFWVGCAGATDPGAIKTTQAVASLLKKAGVSFACLGKEESCTGDPARRTGDEFLFQEKAMAAAAMFERYGVQKVVTACPHCFNSLRNEYGDFGAKLEVWHHSQLLAKLSEEGKLKAANLNPGETALHDPCYLARVNGESDAPRRVLGEQTALNGRDVPTSGPRKALAEPAQLGKKTLCCGAGGGRMWMDEPADQRPANRRVEQLLATGAKEIAVACPFCRIMLDAGVKQQGGDEIRLVDIAEAMLRAND